MNKTKIAVTTGILALALTGIGVGSAMAATVTPSPAPGTSATVTEAPESTTPETTGTEAPESTTPGDGLDGGHADADGVDVNNQGGPNEK